MHTRLSLRIVVCIIGILMLIPSTLLATQSNPFAPRVLAVPTRGLAPVGGQVVPWGDAEYHLHEIPFAATANIIQVAVGAHHALALTKSGTVLGWGTNYSGELTLPRPLENVVQISVGTAHSVALKRDGTVVSWGDPAATTLNTGATLTTVTQLASGSAHTIMLKDNGSVVVMGDSTQRTVPDALTGKIIVAVAATTASSLALDNNGNVYRWGDSTAIPTSAQTGVAKIFAQGGILAAQRTDGQLIIWGDVEPITWATGSNGLGSVVTADATTPSCPCATYTTTVSVRSFEVAPWGVAIGMGNSAPQSFVRNTDSIPDDMPEGATSLGLDPYNRVGLALILDNTPATATPPFERNPLPGIYANVSGDVLVWGGSSAQQTIPTEATRIVQVAAGAHHIVSLRNDGKIIAWGDNTYGQITIPTALQTPPILATDPLRVVAVAAGDNHTLALRANGTVIAWGNNDKNQTTVPSRLTNVTQIAAGTAHSVALKQDGTVVVWGDNTYGQTNLPPLGGVYKIAAAGWHTVALLRNNVVIAWGRNQVGQITIPATSFVNIATGKYNTVLTRRDGTIYVAGDSNFGETITPDGLHMQVAVGSYFLIGITRAQNIVSWGLNNSGQSNIPTSSNRPFAIAAGDDFGVMLAAPEPTATPTPAIMPTVTNTPAIDPNINLTGSLTSRLLARYPMHVGNEPIVFAGGGAQRYTCISIMTCPSIMTDGNYFKFAQFDDRLGDEVTSATSVAIANTSFSVAFWAKRSTSGKPDPVLSLGTTQVTDKLFAMGFDREDHLTCEFFGDDLVTTTWYTDTDWHHYACVYDNTNKSRKLYRDGVVIAEDRANAVFSGTGSLVIGRRNDSATGFRGAIDDVAVYNRVLTNSELLAFTTLPSTNRITNLTFNDIIVNSTTPPNPQLSCEPTTCNAQTFPVTTIDSESNRVVLQFTANSGSLVSSNLFSFKPNFTIAYWAKRSLNGVLQTVLSNGSGNNAITMGYLANNSAFCTIGAVTIQSTPLDSAGHHVACGFNGTTQSLYIDGTSVASSAATYSATAPATAIYLNSLTNRFVGLVDDVTIYDIALLGNQIIDLYNASAIAPLPTMITLTPTDTTTPPATLTNSPTFTRSPTVTRTITQPATKTALKGTITPVMPLLSTYTSTRSTTPTSTMSKTRTSTKTVSMTITPTATKTVTVTSIYTITRTPLFLTRTMLVKRTATYGIQTAVATAKTATAQASITPSTTLTSTAYPLPSPVATSTFFPTTTIVFR